MTPESTVRRDIQLLRGIAVLFVVIYHADLGILNRGYLGVDVFFVISGFLITKIILQGLDSNNFSFRHFYMRRAKRLLPALYSTLFITATFAYWMLTPAQLSDFIAQFIGAVTFSANMVLPTQISYFADEVATKPLLHIWSLSLEEQYYFAIPLVLFFVPRPWRLWTLALLLVVSLVWCISWVTASGPPPFLWRLGDASISDWAFFLFPTRAWELLAGSICAWIMLNRRTVLIWPAIKWASLGTIIIIAFWGVDPVHPRSDAIIVVFASALLVLGNDKWLPDSIYFRSVEKIGDWSYSIYLVHWPIFVFAFLGYVEHVPSVISFALIGLSIGVGYLQYRFIETPFRSHWHHPQGYIWRRVAGASVVLLAIPLAVLAHSSLTGNAPDSSQDIRRVNYGLSKSCTSSFDGESLKPGCIQGKTPTLAVWGDSYAMHLVPGLSQRNMAIVQLTRSVCGPFVGLAPMYGPRYNESWAHECIDHNGKAVSFIEQTDSITHVVMSSHFGQYFGTQAERFLLGEATVQKDRNIAESHLVKTIERLRAAGKTPILVSPPPRSGFNIGSCLEREDLGLLVWRPRCEVNLSDYLDHDKEINGSLLRIGKETGIDIIWIKDLTCEAGRCAARFNDKYLYRDDGHLAVDGSIELFGSMYFGAPPPWRH